MGNEAPVKYSDNEVTLEKRFKALQTILSRNKIRYIDYAIFSNIITSRFERIPRILPECLFLAFASDKSVRIDPKDFISTLTIILGSDTSLIKKFVFRVYDIKLSNNWDRENVEAILRNAYGIRSNSGPGIDGKKTEAAKVMMDAIFSTIAVKDTRRDGRESRESRGSRDGRRSSRDNGREGRESGAKVTQYTARKRTSIYNQDFQTYNGDIDILVQWIVRVLSVFVEPPSSRLLRIDRRYSNSMDTADMMAKYNITEANCDRLRKVFHTRCGSSKAELTLDSWIDWCLGYLTPSLAAAIFRAKSRTFKLIWKFVDFADFCLVLGVGTGLEKAGVLCKMFYSAFNKNEITSSECSSDESTKGGNKDGHDSKRVETFLQCMRRMVLLLAQSYEPIDSSSTNHHFSANSNVYSEHMPRPSLIITGRSRSTSTGSGGMGSPLSPERRPSLAVADLDDDDKYASSLDMLESKVYLPESVRKELEMIESQAREPGQDIPLTALLQLYVELLVNHESNLPGLRELSMTASCLFGVRPPSPHLEKEYVMEIMMRRQAEFPQSRTNPFGPLGAAPPPMAPS